jgi:hypothetical protein
MARKTPDWMDRFHSALPTHEALSKHPWFPPVAAAMTMLTNPLTVGFWLWLAYQLGYLGVKLGSRLYFLSKRS